MLICYACNIAFKNHYRSLGCWNEKFT